MYLLAPCLYAADLMGAHCRGRVEVTQSARLGDPLERVSTTSTVAEQWTAMGNEEL